MKCTYALKRNCSEASKTCRQRPLDGICEPAILNSKARDSVWDTRNTLLSTSFDALLALEAPKPPWERRRRAFSAPVLSSKPTHSALPLCAAPRRGVRPRLWRRLRGRRPPRRAPFCRELWSREKNPKETRRSRCPEHFLVFFGEVAALQRLRTYKHLKSEHCPQSRAQPLRGSEPSLSVASW